VVPDIPLSGCAEQSVRNRVRYNIGIRMAFESMRVGNFNSTQDETAPEDEAMHIVANSAEKHGQDSDIGRSN
jgi:hypothetical protein